MMRKLRFVPVFLSAAALAVLTGCTPDNANDAKPVIYLYPEQEEKVTVELDYSGELTCTYPAYDGGWTVTAQPDGTLTDETSGKEYNYLFWEGTTDIQYDFSSGFVVAGGDTAQFLEEKLAYMGLNERERNEFIVYWLPQMEENAYNLIAFQGDVYTDHARLHITPEPDSMLRVFMAYKPLDRPVTVPEQQLASFEREGFTVVEWGGARIE